MSLNWRRILALIAFLAAVVLISYGLYFVFLKPAIPTEPGPDGININVSDDGLPQAGLNTNIPILGNINGTLPGSNVNDSQITIPGTTPASNTRASDTATGGLTKINALTTSPAFNTTLAGDGNNAVYYDRNAGVFYKVTPDGTISPLSNKVFHQVENITWSSGKNKAILEYPDGSNIVYDFSTDKQVTLPAHWKDFSFSPNDDRIVLKSMGLDEENRWLAVTNTDGTKAQKIEALGDKDATVYTGWSANNQIIAMYTEDKNFDQQDLFFVGLNGENFKSTTIEGRGFQSQWSTGGDTLLYSVYSSATDYKPTLWIVGAEGDSIGRNRKSLRLQTWADKCTFSSNQTVYCAVPQSLQEGAGIFANELDTSPTDIYKIDITTGIRTKIATPESDVNIANLFISDGGNYLYFTNKDDGRLYNIKLK